MPEEDQIPVRRHSRRARRRVTRKRSFFSFGDIILPFVGVLAIGLLFLAAKLFFFGGFNGTPPASGVALARTDQVQDQVQVQDPIGTPELGENSSTVSAELEPVALVTDQNMPAPPSDYDPTSSREELKVSEPKPEPPAPAAQAPSSAKPAPAKPATSSPQTKPAASTPAKPAAPAPAKTARPAPAKPAGGQPNTGSQWRVQVGAYGSKQAAQNTVNDLAKSGYKAVIFAGPRFQKVWVLAGTTQKEAEAVRNKLQAGGFPQSYLVPPAQSK